MHGLSTEVVSYRRNKCDLVSIHNVNKTQTTFYIPNTVGFYLMAAIYNTTNLY